MAGSGTGNVTISTPRESMNCIFCKGDSGGSRSVEHVIPESLGNTEHILNTGIVYDQCNNYFASKVEGPLLSDPYFQYQFSQADIATKKGRPSRVRGLHPQSRTVIEIVRNLDGSGISVGAAFENDLTPCHSVTEKIMRRRLRG